MTRRYTTYRLCGMLVLAVALAVLALPGSAASAAEASLPESPQESTPEPAASTEPQTGDALRIDNTDLFAGMDSTYQDGYMPSVGNGFAHVVLPLLPVLPGEGERIVVSVNLGDPATSPFVFRNYDQTIWLREHEANEGADTVDAYLVDLSLELAPRHEAGRYPVTLSASGSVEETRPFTQVFTVYVTIPGELPSEEPSDGSGKGDDGDSGDSGGMTGDTGSSGGGEGGDPGPAPAISEPTPAPQPKVIAASYSTNPAPVLAGQTFLLTMTLRNTSSTHPMRNVKITVNGEGAEILPAGGENSFYFASIAQAKEVVLQTQMKAAETAQPGPQRIVVHIDYDGDQQTPYSSDETITVLVVQPLRVECETPEIPAHINAGDTLTVPVNVMDMGRGTVYNVRAQLEAPGLTPEGSVFLGNIESGASKKGELYAFIGTLADTSEDGERYGQTAGTITVTYEDELGVPSEQILEFTTTIEPPVIGTPAPSEEEEAPQTQRQWWISVLIAGGIIAAAVGIVLYRRQNAREDAGHEDW